MWEKCARFQRGQDVSTSAWNSHIDRTKKPTVRRCVCRDRYFGSGIERTALSGSVELEKNIADADEAKKDREHTEEDVDDSPQTSPPTVLQSVSASRTDKNRRRD